MLETAVLFDKSGNPFYLWIPSGRTTVSLPDSPDLWDIIWENRDIIGGIAHSHPGKGQPRPSQIDITTFSAIERGLAERLNWFICSEDELIFLWWSDKQNQYKLVPVPEGSHVQFRGLSLHVLPWINLLRSHSNYGMNKRGD